MQSHCYLSVCFFHLSKDAPKFFGFAEYIGAVALMALAWTIADIRYKFRIATAPIPLQITTFVVVGAIGFLTLLTDLWRAEQWLVPEGKLTFAGWQALLGFVFLLNFMLWVGFAFIRPLAYSEWNAYRFARVVYRVVLRGSPSELPEIADELVRSARNLVKHAWQGAESEIVTKMPRSPDWWKRRKYTTRQYAHEIFLIIADTKFCRHAVESAPIIALALFEEVKEQGRYRVHLGTFARNFTAASIANKDSFAYHESEGGYVTGYMGYQKPIMSAVYGSYTVVAQLERVFDISFSEQKRWDSDQWRAFGRLLLITAQDFFAGGWASQYPPVFGRAFHDIENSVMSLSKINGDPSDGWQSDELEKLRVAVQFVLDFIKIMNENAEKIHNVKLRRRKGEQGKDVCDLVADLMFELIVHASYVKAPRNLCWFVQHNYVWSDFFDMSSAKGTAAQMIIFKLKRLLLDEVADIGKYPNYKNTRVLGLMLNVMGLREHRESYAEATHSLHRAVIRWTIKNYARLAAKSPTVMANALVEGTTYDPDGPRLIYTREPLLDRKIEPIVLNLQPYIPEN